MFLGYINSFRAVAILFIVAGHSLAVFNWVNSPELERILKMIVSNGTVLFVYIAGYLFQHLLPKYSYKKYFFNKFKNVLLPYFIISIPAIFYYVAFAQREQVWPSFYDEPIWLQVLNFYLTGVHLSPMWFIPMITLFYIASPLLLKLDKTNWFYPLLVVFLVLTYYQPRGLVYMSFMHFFSVYVFGMWCSHYKHIINPYLSKTKTLMFLVFIYFLMLFAEYHFVEVINNINTLRKLVLSLWIVGVFIKLGSDFKSKKVELIANLSFGIFFVHSYVLFPIKMIVKKYQTVLESGNVFGYYVLVCLITMMLSIGIVLLIKRMLGEKSRYIIGS